MYPYQDFVSHFVRDVGVQSPIFLVWLGGILWACLTWRRHPRKSFLVVLALGTFLVGGLVEPVAWHYLFFQGLVEGQYAPGILDRLLLYVQGALAVLHAALWLLLLAALFMEEGTTAVPRGPDGEPLPPDWAQNPGTRN